MDTKELNEKLRKVENDEQMKMLIFKTKKKCEEYYMGK